MHALLYSIAPYTSGLLIGLVLGQFTAQGGSKFLAGACLAAWFLMDVMYFVGAPQ